MRSIFSSDKRSSRLDCGDKKLMWALTLIYTVFTLLNLGTLPFPTSVYTASHDGTAVEIDLGGEYAVSEIWTNGSIAEGTAIFSADDGTTAEYAQSYGGMYTWRSMNTAMVTRYITMRCTVGTVSLNEATAMFALSHFAESAVRGSTQHLRAIAVCSAFEILAFIYAARVCLQHGFPQKDGGE